jgi:multicomponent K+:H+ antiporter subunit C
MNLLFAIMIGCLVGVGVFFILQPRIFSLILGLVLLGHAVNVVLFASGRLISHHPPLLQTASSAFTDPLPQALVLTAIVIGFALLALIFVLSLRILSDTNSAKQDSGTKHP